MTTVIHIPILEIDFSGKPKKRKVQRIPGMNSDHSCKSKYKRTDAEVIAIIIRSLYGETLGQIALKEDLSQETIKAWVQGTNRRSCYLEALDQYRAELRNGIPRGR